MVVLVVWFSQRIALDDALGQSEHLGSDLQLGAPHRGRVDFEAHLLVLDQEIDDPAGLQESGGIGHRQHAVFAEGPQKHREVFGLGSAEEQHVTVLDPLESRMPGGQASLGVRKGVETVESADHHAPIPDEPVLKLSLIHI